MSRRRTSSPAPASVSAHPLEDEDLLEQILLHLPPQPSFLPRASLVCTRWRRLLCDPAFFRRFRAHHRKSPVLAFFHQNGISNALFTPVLDPPDRIPQTRFPFLDGHDKSKCTLQDCRHGLALLFDWLRREAVVWDPIAGRHRCVAFPSRFCHSDEDWSPPNGAVMRTAVDDDGHVHGDRHFKLLLVRHGADGPCAACLYESESGAWGNIISTPTGDEVSTYSTSVMVGNTVCWLLHGNNILQFDVERQSLVVIDKPARSQVAQHSLSHQILRTEDGGLGLAVLTGQRMEVWVRMKSNSGGVVTWLLQKTVELDKFLLLGSSMVRPRAYLRGYVEEHNAIIVAMNYGKFGVFMVQHSLMQFNKLFESKVIFRYRPYTSFWAAGKAFGDGLEDLTNACCRRIN